MSYIAVMLEDQLNAILVSPTGERGVSRFLANHPELVRWAFCETGGHSAYVVREFPFGSLTRRSRIENKDC